MDTWTRSSLCDTSHCIEAKVEFGEVLVRDSRDEDTVLLVDLDSWRTFLDGVRNGDFDL